MRIGTGAGAEDRKKLIAVAVFVAIAAGVAYYELYGGTTPAPQAVTPAAGGSVAAVDTPSASPAPTGPGKTANTTSAATLDPTLRMEAMLVSESVEYSGSGRNIFSAASAPLPVAIPKPIGPARPMPPPIQTISMPAAPPPPPPINLEFFGTETAADGTRQAFLLHTGDVFIASQGDVVMRRYRVVTITPSTVEVEDMQYSHTQVLPLVAN